MSRRMAVNTLFSGFRFSEMETWTGISSPDFRWAESSTYLVSEAVVYFGEV